MSLYWLLHCCRELAVAFDVSKAEARFLLQSDTVNRVGEGVGVRYQSRRVRG